MRDVRLHHWPPFSRKREIQDVVHGPISLFHPLDCVVDTREFQRLRELKQLGVTYLVYPCSTHSRFVHCLGLPQTFTLKDSSGQWLPRGRPVEKAFLYDIVSNDNDSFDVDKFDYLIRDSQSANFAIPLDKVRIFGHHSISS
ncbi:unnamed protein product [Nippostrongylus brasiliensis]|uniref:Exostosin domain-containing protein n=1 Tax=Nippostrongylus brasiliensis TaxID=27835 RepID=A0A0N4XVG9_NIPBR|nr:unnamed protein product [Nippostrongylus brasiliensis]